MKMMKKLTALLLCCCMLCGLFISPAAALEFGEEWEGSESEKVQRYSDVPVTHWAFDAIERATEKEWFKGYPDGTFAPTKKISRSEAVVVIARFLDLQINDFTGTQFHDITGSEWYAPYIQSASELLPIHTNNTNRSAFQATKPITREDVIYALIVALGYASEVRHIDESILNMYADQNSISGDVRAFVAHAVELGLISGKKVNNQTCICAQDPLSRAEFATMLYRATSMGVGPDGWFTGNKNNDTAPAGGIDSVTISPVGRYVCNVGDVFTITATANKSDKTTEEYTNINAYNEDNNGVVTITGNSVKAERTGFCTIKFNDDYLKNQSIVVIVNQGAGTLSLTVNDYENPTTAASVTLTGTAVDSTGSAVTLECDGETVAVAAGGAFSVTKALTDGVNSFRLVAKNAAGNEVTKEVSVLKQAAVTTANGTLLGKVCKASDRTTAISGATVGVYNGDTQVATCVSESDGSITLSAPAGEYQLKASATGYIPYTGTATVTANESTYVETILLVADVPNERGTASGKIVNAFTGAGLDGVALTAKSSSGEAVATATTPASGEYSFELPTGNYTVDATKNGFIPVSFNIVVQSGQTGNQDASMSPELAEGTFRVVLTWGEHPRDLDSHVQGTLTNGSSFHVYYMHMRENDGSDQVCALDVDDVTSYGPETITLNPKTSSPYYYYIYKYAGEGSIDISGAQIKLYSGDSLLATYNAPTNQGSARYWNVFALVNGRVVPRNTITDSADVSYAG